MFKFLELTPPGQDTTYFNQFLKGVDQAFGSLVHYLAGVEPVQRGLFNGGYSGKFEEKILLSKPAPTCSGSVDSNRQVTLDKLSEHGAIAGGSETNPLSEDTKKALLSAIERTEEAVTGQSYHAKAKQFKCSIEFLVDSQGQTSEVGSIEFKVENGQSIAALTETPKLSTEQIDELANDIASNLPEGRYRVDVMVSSDSENVTQPSHIDSDIGVRMERSELYAHQDRFSGLPLDYGKFDYLGFSILDQNVAPTESLLLAKGQVNESNQAGGFRGNEITDQALVPAKKGAWYFINQNHRDANNEVILHGNSGIRALIPGKNHSIEHFEHSNSRELDSAYSGPCSETWKNYVEEVNQRSPDMPFHEHAKRVVTVLRINDIPLQEEICPDAKELLSDSPTLEKTITYPLIDQLYEFVNRYNRLSNEDNRIAIEYRPKENIFVIQAKDHDKLEKFKQHASTADSRSPIMALNDFTRRFISDLSASDTTAIFLDRESFEYQYAKSLSYPIVG